MSKQKELLITIADAEHARLVRRTPTNGFRTERSFDSVAAHKRSAELGSDHPGASFHSDSTAHHAMTPQHDPQELEKEKFARAVADELNDMPPDAFDALLIVAPSHSLNEIRARLNGTTAAKLVGTLAKDLAKTPDADLWSHLKDMIPPGPPPRRD
jgi:protein required for attachment to host cells